MDNFKEGYCIAITNDPSCVGIQVSIIIPVTQHLELIIIVLKEVSWAANIGSGTNKNREEALRLKNFNFY